MKVIRATHRYRLKECACGMVLFQADPATTEELLEEFEEILLRARRTRRERGGYLEFRVLQRDEERGDGHEGSA